MLNEKMIQKLIRLAFEARNFAYAVYSNYPVGAALLCADGTIYTGCNVENAAYSPGNCAERTAVFKAVSEGNKDYIAIAIVGGQGCTSPCGVCRQVLREFVNPEEFLIIMPNNDNNKIEGGETKEENMTYDYVKMTLNDLLPMSFGPENLR